MKKILLSTIVLLGFSLSIILFQVSCKKDANAETPVTSAGVFLYSIYNDNLASVDYYVANIDGTNSRKIVINLPSGYSISGSNAKLTPDGKTLIFGVANTANKKFIYSCGVDGSNVKQVIDGSANTGNGIGFEILGAY